MSRYFALGKKKKQPMKIGSQMTNNSLVSASAGLSRPTSGGANMNSSNLQTGLKPGNARFKGKMK